MSAAAFTHYVSNGPGQYLLTKKALAGRDIAIIPNTERAFVNMRSRRSDSPTATYCVSDDAVTRYFQFEDVELRISFDFKKIKKKSKFSLRVTAR
jgi:hypothetical protein